MTRFEYLTQDPSRLRTRTVVEAATPNADGGADLPGLIVSYPFEADLGQIGVTFTRVQERISKWPTRVAVITSDREFDPKPSAETLYEWATRGERPNGAVLRMNEANVIAFESDSEHILVGGHDSDILHAVYAVGIREVAGPAEQGGSEASQGGSEIYQGE